MKISECQAKNRNYILKGGSNMPKPDGVSSDTHSQSELDDYANQNNPNNDAYQDDLDNHADQLNPNNEEFKR